MTPWWSDLSGAEIRVRLKQRGVPAGTADTLVYYRDTFDAAEAITEVLGDTPGR